MSRVLGIGDAARMVATARSQSSGWRGAAGRPRACWRAPGERSTRRTSARRPSSRRPPPSCGRTASPCELGGHDLERIARASLVVASPGVPPDAPPFVAARDGGRRHRQRDRDRAALPAASSNYIAITGTNGKTTTTALIGHLLKSLGRRASTAGNIGTPLTELALSATPPDVGRARGLVVPAARHAEHQPARRRADEPVGESPRPVRRACEEYFADKALLFRNAGPGSHWVTNARRRRRAGDGRSDVPGMTLPLLGAAAQRRVSSIATTAMLVVLGQPLIHRERAVAARRPQRRERARRVARRDGRRPRSHARRAGVELIARGARVVHGARAPHRDGGRVRRRHVDQRLQVDERRVDARRDAGHDAADGPAARRKAQGRALHRSRPRAASGRDVR